MFDKAFRLGYNTTRAIVRCIMRLNVNKLLHTPDARQDVRFEMDLSDLEFGGSYPVSRPVVVDCRLENKAGLLLCGMTLTTTLHCTCDRCGEEYDADKTVRYDCVLAEERASDESDDIIVLDNDEVDVEELARSLQMSTSHFIRTFKTQVGYSPLAYQTRLRIERAKDLLQATDLRVSEIAQRIGYQNPMYFSSTFKKHTGMTPLEYREKSSLAS